MKHTLLVLALLAPLRSWALYEVGDAIPDMCWADATNAQVCLAQSTETVRVLVYNTGWCPDCQNEFTELAPRAQEFAKEPVTFFSLSSEGWKRGAPADSTFLTEWKTRFSIPFAVAASPMDPGRKFFNAPYFIPRVVIIDKAQRLAFKQTTEMEELTVDSLFSEIRKVLKP